MATNLTIINLVVIENTNKMITKTEISSNEITMEILQIITKTNKVSFKTITSKLLKFLIKD